MQYALMTEPQAGGDYDDLVGLARWAEGYGLSAFARSDHYLDMGESKPATDAFATLGGLARDTGRIKLTVLVSPITFRHPAIIAKTAATIDQMSGGRFELGIGTGWMEAEHESFGIELPGLRDRFSQFYESLAYVTAAFGRSENGYHGRHYDLAEIDVLPPPTGSLPIIVGGSGTKKTPMMAGRFADEYNTFAGDLADLEPRIETMQKAAAEFGRDPDGILISIAVPAFFGADEADYGEVLAEAAASRDLEPSTFADRLTARGIPHGTADRLGEYLAAAGGLGVGRVYLQEYKHLAAIDTDRLERVLSLLPT